MPKPLKFDKNIVNSAEKMAAEDFAVLKKHNYAGKV